MTLHRILPLLVLMLDLLLLGAALAAGGRRTGRNRAFAYLSLALAAWHAGALGLRWSDTARAALAWEWVVHLGVAAIPVLFYRYVFALLGDSRRRPSLTVGYVVAAALVATVPTRAFMTGVEWTQWGFAPTPGPLYGVFIAYFMTYMTLGLIVLVRAYPGATSPFRRHRLRLVIAGVVISLLGGIVDFLRFLLDLEALYPAGIPASAVFAVTLGVAIVRYRLMDMTVIARHAVLYALAWAVVAPLVLIANEVVHVLLPVGSEELGRRQELLFMLAGLVLGLPVMRRLERLLDRVMFRRQHAITEALVALNRQLSGILDVRRLADTLTTGLTSRIPVRHAGLWVPERASQRLVCLSASRGLVGDDAADQVLPDDAALWVRATHRSLVVDDIGCDVAADGPGVTALAQLEQAHVGLVIPLTPDVQPSPILVVGEKLSGEVFSTHEIQLLEVLAGRAGTALNNARLYQDLETQMAELTATRRLYGEAREAGRARERFLAMLAHELRNPLAPIVNAAHVLDVVAGHDPRTSPMIAIVRRQAQQLSRLVDDLLDMSRIQLGKIRLSERPVDLGRLLAQCVETLRSSGKGHDREVSTSLPAESVVVRGDAVRLEQVFWNLLDNALKYSPAGSPVTVSLHVDGDHAVACVRDEGIGIAPEMLEAVFELFTQADVSLERAQGGLGLGLALVRSLIEQHGGTVKAHSGGPGQGSAFIVRLPLTVAAPESPDRRPAAGVEGGRRVLVAEDRADTRESLRTLLEVAGHEVRCVEDGLDAVDAATTWRPDVALIDIGLPGIDGYEVARRLRQDAATHDVHLVALTGYGQPADRQHALDSGFDAHLVKPVAAETILKLVTRPVQRRT